MYCMSQAEKAQTSHSRAIDRAIVKDKHLAKNQMQLLLLGRSRAGKTTLVKQLKSKTGDGFTQDEVESFRLTLLENLLDAMRVLLNTREELLMPWNNESLEEEALVIWLKPLHRLLDERGWKTVITMLVRLWQEEGMRKAWKHAFGLPGMECLPHFLNGPVRLCAQNYVPSTDDIMRTYQSTCGVKDTEVHIEDAAFRLVEMGGNSLTSPKLLHFFDNVSAVIFVASCSDVERKYCLGVITSGFLQTSDNFAAIVKHSALHKLPMILLITKLDQLMEKAKHLDLKTVFPDLNGNPQEIKDVKKYLVGVFKSKCGERHIYHHFLSATDHSSVQTVFADIKRDIRDSILRKLLPQ